MRKAIRKTAAWFKLIGKLRKDEEVFLESRKKKIGKKLSNHPEINGGKEWRT